MSAIGLIGAIHDCCVGDPLGINYVESIDVFLALHNTLSYTVQTYRGLICTETFLLNPIAVRKSSFDTERKSFTNTQEVYVQHTGRKISLVALSSASTIAARSILLYAVG